MSKLWVKATKLKLQFFATVSEASEIEGAELTTALKELESSISDFGREFLENTNVTPLKELMTKLQRRHAS